jgi:predicted ester cyclase
VSGDLRGESPTGREVVQTGINIYRVANGRLAEQWAQFDLAGLLRQLDG